MCAVVALRSTRAHAAVDAVNAVILTALSAIALWACLDIAYERASAAREPKGPPRYKAAFQIFLPQMWAQLSATECDGTSLGPLRPSGVGLVEHPGLLPFDAYLLQRESFISVPVQILHDMLGPPLPRLPNDDKLELVYFMPNGPGGLTADLTFRLAPGEHDSLAVTSEKLFVHRPQP